jgi:2-polyprenyl-3-methyl-5-hydroxy-6-metoxy-1,4-benzoquinol methylase
VRNYFTDSEYLASEMGQGDLANHLDLRYEDDRVRAVPWVESFLPLSKARILEVGCGTGSSTLALAERGARVTATDILPASIQVADDRCKAYGYTVDFLTVNAADLKGCFPAEHFDAIIFYAALEHMTHEERRAAMRDTWEMLAPGSYWIVIDTPNRLWHFDAHTSLLPFFNWLPDRLAFEYSRFSSRNYFREIYLAHTPEKELHFLRRGRGVSFHEFELFMAPRQDLDIASCLHTYFRARDPEEDRRWIESKASAYEDILRSACPDLHPAFLQQNLDLAIRKH